MTIESDVGFADDMFIRADGLACLAKATSELSRLESAFARGRGWPRVTQAKLDAARAENFRLSCEFVPGFGRAEENRRIERAHADARWILHDRPISIEELAHFVAGCALTNVVTAGWDDSAPIEEYEGDDFFDSYVRFEDELDYDAQGVPCGLLKDRPAIHHDY